MKLKDSPFIINYKQQLLESVMSIDRTLDKDVVSDRIDKMIDKNITNPNVILDNNYTNQSKETTLLSVIDWAILNKPIIAGNGTFYKRHDQAINPRGVMLQSKLDSRSAIKKKMFKMDDFSSYEYMAEDNNQKNEKIIANSYYGGSGAKTSSLYSKWSGPATTLSAQQIIATTTKTFEGFLADNYQFISFNELFDWLSVIEKESLDGYDHIHKVSVELVYKRLMKSLICSNKLEVSGLLMKYLLNLNDNELKRIYYKNNLIQFIDDHEYIKDLYRKAFSNITNLEYIEDEDWDRVSKEFKLDTTKYKNAKTWNKHVNFEYFMDPNHAPDSIKEYVDMITNDLFKYVYVRYLPFDRIYRMKNFKRRCVLVIDTDSNILTLDEILGYLQNNVMESDYGRDEDKNTFIGVNTITNTLTKVVTDILIRYGETSNIPEELRPKLNMKNEFYFGKLIVGKSKKRYIAKMILREGTLLKKPKTSVTGFDFIKSKTPIVMENFFMDLINKYLLKKDMDIKGMYQEIIAFANVVRKSLENKELTYLPISSVKPMSAYKNPSSIPAVRGTVLWDTLNPEEPIELPSKPKLLKLKLFQESQLDVIKDSHPVEYALIKERVFNESEVAIRNGGAIYASVAKGGKINYKGCNVLIIPTSEEIPDWAIPFVDYDTIINNIFAPFKSVLEIFYFKNFSIGKDNRKSDKLTNIVKF